MSKILHKAAARGAFAFLAAILLGSICHSQEPEQVDWKADITRYTSTIGQGAIRLLGNVIFTHEGTLMYCDSAYFYQASNSLDAFSNVHINQGDSIHVYGDIMHYNGNTRMADINRNVRLEGENTTLVTSHIDYDLGERVGYYTNHADIESGENLLSSRLGYYYAEEEMYYFEDSVVLINPDYIIYSDTLRYHTPTSIAYFIGPTEIVSDSTYIFCERGWYNTEENTSMLKRNALVRNETQEVSADSLFYNRDTGYGELYSNIEMEDTEQNIILMGNIAFMNDVDDWAILTDSAQFIYITEEDSIYVHADTLRAFTDNEGYRQLKAYYGVRIYKSDLQGMCDSLFYSTADSIMRFYNQPVLWAGENQLTADYIEVRTKNQEVDQLFMDQVALIINQEDTSKYNQIRGASMTGFFREGDLYRLEVNGNGQTVYYVSDNEELIGVNVAESSDMTIYFNDNEADSILYKVRPTGVLYPIQMAPQEELILEDFSWQESLRPKSKMDIYRK